ncbi:MAG: hypothetical protein WAZ18_02430 [Alphaproteobacteria bacterium]
MKLNATAIIQRIQATEHAHLRSLATTFLTISEQNDLGSDELEFMIGFLSSLGGEIKVKIHRDETYYKDMLEGEFVFKEVNPDNVKRILATIAIRLNAAITEDEIESNWGNPLRAHPQLDTDR